MGEAIGSWIRENLDERCWTHERLAEEIGVVASTVDSWEQGETEPRGTYYDGLVKLFGNPPILRGDDFAVWLRDKLAQAQMKQAELARRLNVSPRTVQYWLAGTYSPSRQHMQKIQWIAERMMSSGDGIILRPPIALRHYPRCEKCPEMARCKGRVMDGLPAMCEALTREELELIMEFAPEPTKRLQELLWWFDVDEGDSIEQIFEKGYRV